MTPEEWSEMRLTVARIDERLKAYIEAETLLHRSISEKLDLFATKESVEAVSARVDRIESDMSWVRRTSFGAFLAAVGTFVLQHFLPAGRW